MSGVANGDGVAAGAALERAAAKVAPRARRVVRLARLDVAALRAQDDARRAALGADWKRWDRIGVERDLRPVVVPPFPSRWGTRAETLPDGSRVFRVEVDAPGATGLRVRLRRAELPPGAELTVHNADRPAEAYGPLRVPKDAAGFLAPTVFGSRAVLALRIPATALDRRVTLVADGVTQKYRAPEEDPSDVPAKSAAGTHGEPRAAGLGCMKSVACDADWTADVSRAVARVEFTSGGNLYLCSGTLLNDLDDTTQVPWFLTANHCVSTEKVAKTVEVFWDYRASTCGGSPPSLHTVPRTDGATLVATTEGSDSTLVRLTGTFPSNRYFCGWTATRPRVGDAVVGVHHPEGSHMRISKGTLDASGGNFHTVVWNDGVTAQGSSGSGLFNASKQVIGQLCCGTSYCSAPRDPDDYGRFDVSYAAVYDPFLGRPPVVPGPDAWDPWDDVAAGAVSLSAPTEAGIVHGPHKLYGDDAADWFSVPLAAGVPYLFEASGAVQAVLYGDPDLTDVVASSPGGPTGFSVIATPSIDGFHYLRVTRASPSIDTEFSFLVSRQDLTPPRAVKKLRAMPRGRGRVRLAWRDRARDEVGYRVEVLGVLGWVRVGDLPANSTRFDHRPGPGLQVYRVGPYDPVSTNWSEVHVKVKGRPGRDAWDPADDTGPGATQLAAVSDLTPVHELDRNDYADWYRIDLEQGRTCVFETLGDDDTVGALYADAGGLVLLAEADDQEGADGAIVDNDFRIDFTAPAAGTYWLEVRAYPATPRATYRLRTTLQ